MLRACRLRELPGRSTSGLRDFVDPQAAALVAMCAAVGYYVRAHFHTLLVDDAIPQYLASVVWKTALGCGAHILRCSMERMQ
jgi:hypothetical protein